METGMNPTSSESCGEPPQSYSLYTVHPGFWDWTWWCEMRQEICWIPTGPALLVCSGLTRPPPAASMTGSRKRRRGSDAFGPLLTLSVCSALMNNLSVSAQTRLQNLEMRRQTLFSTVHTYSLLMNLKNFVCNIGEDAELLMSLYDPDQSEFIRSVPQFTFHHRTKVT